MTRRQKSAGPREQGSGYFSSNDVTGRNRIEARLAGFAAMPTKDLRTEWQRLYRSPAPSRVARDLLLLGVAWKIQEQACGGLSAATKRRLAELSKTIERDGDVKRERISRLKSGATLVREWRGKTHTVIVTEDGFQWNGRAWRSLSSIARAITGVHWSGPRFFGLTINAAKTVGREPGAADA